MEFVFGFIITILMALISSIPFFIWGNLKKDFKKIDGIAAFMLCGIIYAILKATFEHIELIAPSNIPIPITVMFYYWCLYNYFTNKQKV